MYTDPSLVREHTVKLSFNDREADLINAWVAYTGQQKAALLREMLLEQARLELDAAMSERPQSVLFSNS
jgi:L-rhamnose isomerase